MAQGCRVTPHNAEAIFDELLCEYVDGTIDTSVRAAFEECMSADKSLAQRVECLGRLRKLLRRHRCCVPHDVHLRVRARLDRELLSLQKDCPDLRKLSPFLSTGSVLSLIFCAILLTGSTDPLVIKDDSSKLVQSESPNYSRLAPQDSTPVVTALPVDTPVSVLSASLPHTVLEQQGTQ